MIVTVKKARLADFAVMTNPTLLYWASPNYTSATPTREGDLLEQHVDEHFEVLQSISNHFEAL